MSMTYLATEYSSPFGLEKQMGYSRQEYLGLLNQCLSGYDFNVSEKLITIKVPCGCIEIHIGEEGERVFTELVKFPVLPIEIKFIEVSDSERSRFLRKHDHTYMKGLA